MFGKDKSGYPTRMDLECFMFQGVIGSLEMVLEVFPLK